MRIKIYADAMYITDLTNALKAGQICKEFTVYMSVFNRVKQLFAHEFQNWLDDWPMEEFIKKLLIDHNDFMGIDVSGKELKAVRVFSPFVAIKPIKIPAKWTLAHVWKAILSGQISTAEKRMHLTDDYAHDSAYNFGKGPIDPLILAQEIITSPSGWWVNIKDVQKEVIELGLNCHHFDYNTLYFRPGAA